MLDGATLFALFTRILLPILTPTIASVIFVNVMRLRDGFLLPPLIRGAGQKYMTPQLAAYLFAGHCKLE